VAEPSLDNLLSPPAEPELPAGAPLAPPDPVGALAPEQAAGLVPLMKEVRAGLAAKARSFVEELLADDPRSPSFAKRVDDLATMGEADLRASARAGIHLRQRPRERSGGVDPTNRVTAGLSALRTVVADLDPSRLDPSPGAGLRRLLARTEPPERYFARYQASQVTLDRLIGDLVNGQDELRRDNAAIATDQAEARAMLTKLSEYATLAGFLDTELEARIDGLRRQGRTDAADVVATEALTAARRRRQEVLTHLAVVAQSTLALDVVRRNNVELIRGVERARTATLRALRTAVAAARVLTHEQLVLDRITALDARAAAQVADEDADVDALRAAFGEVRAAMDELDRYRDQAGANLDATVRAFGGDDR
jgi:uncharacterized protein YaaN involved in tellurite resistance